jgi:Arc/MetJ-type ribon-helix-helix transcriptional regulator
MGKLPLALRRKDAESEKITINLGYIDLGQIDLLVQEGFYSNRTDFIRTAIRTQLGAHSDVLKQTVARRSLVLGLQRYTRLDLESLRAAGEQLHIQVLGLATIDDDVPAQLAAQTIASIVVLGALRATPEVKAALADRIR